MPTPVFLEDFEVPTRGSLAKTPSAAVVEEQRLTAFEQGYKAGWDDAAAAQTEDTSRISADFANNLRDLSFSFHEARAHVLAGAEPLIRDMVARVLPEIARATLPQIVGERIDAILQETADRPVRLMVSPATRPALEQILPSDPGFPLEVVEEPTLGEGQIFLRAGTVEQGIDLGRVLTEITALVDDYFTLSEKEVVNG